MAEQPFVSDVELTEQEQAELLADAEALGFPEAWTPDAVGLSGGHVVVVPDGHTMGWAWTAEDAIQIGLAFLHAGHVLQSIEGGAVVWRNTDDG